MADVNLLIDGRSYSVACDEGQEKRLSQLGAYVDARMRDTGIAGTNNKGQAMALASLVLADEIFDMNEKLSSMEKALSEAHGQVTTQIEYQGLSPKDEQNVVDLIGQMAAKVEKLTARVQKKSA